MARSLPSTRRAALGCLSRRGQNAVTLRFRIALVRFIAAVLTGLFLPVSAQAGELFRYRLQTEDGRQFEYLFEASAQPAFQELNDEQGKLGGNKSGGEQLVARRGG